MAASRLTPPSPPIASAIDQSYRTTYGTAASSYGATPAYTYSGYNTSGVGCQSSMVGSQSISLYGGAAYLPTSGYASLPSSGYSAASYGLVDAKAM